MHKPYQEKKRHSTFDTLHCWHVWHRPGISNLCCVCIKDEYSIKRDRWRLSSLYFGPYMPALQHIFRCAWLKGCFLTLFGNWLGVDARHTKIKSHIPPPLRKIEKLYESCSLPLQQSPRYSLLHLDIHMETRGFLSSRSVLLNCLHKCG